MSTRVMVATLALTLAGLAGLSACGGSSSTPPNSASSQVASLKAPTTSAPKTSVSMEDERPLIRSDTTDAEYRTLLKPFLACLEEHGMPAAASKGGGGYDADYASKYHEQCGGKEPESMLGRAEAEDPAYSDHLHADIKCQKDHGVPLKLDGLPSKEQAHWMDYCENQAFASYYETLP